MISIPAGSMNRRITLMQPTTAQNPLTGDAMPPVDLPPVWAHIKPMNGSEIYRSQQFTDEANIMVTIRYMAGVHANMTVVYGARTFQILAVLNEEEANVQLNLLCKELNP